MRLDVKFTDDSQDFTAELSGESQAFPAKFGAVQPATIGIPGASAYEIAVKHGFEGTEEEWLASLEGEPGYTPVKGVDYFDGQDGYAPVRGTDYWTEADKQKVVGDVLQNAFPGFCTEISRGKGSSNKVIRVTCHGLKEGETYSLHLYTSSRRRGSSQEPWRHPSNENDGENYTGKGYANLVGQRYSSYQENELYPDVPGWMPNNGILQTEWEFIAEKEKEVLEIEIGTWLLPMLKPIYGDFENDTYGLIGVSNRAIAPLLFQFRLVKDGTVGLCQNTLRIGLAKQRVLGIWQTGLIKYVASKKKPIIDAQYLYTSIQQ